jgi:hypothetical protein
MSEAMLGRTPRVDAQPRRIWIWRVAAAWGLAIALVLPARAQFRELVAKLPKSANAVVLLNVDKALDSPMGIREGWKKKIEKSFAAGMIRVPPQATDFVLASQIDLEFMQPIWSAAVMNLSENVSIPQIAERRGGTLDQLENLSGAALPNDTYVVRFAPRTVGAMQPANRQSVLRWIREVQGGKGEVSPYLQKAAGYSDDAATDIIMAIDLDGALSWEWAAKYLKRNNDRFKLSDADLKDAATVLGGVQGVRLGIRLADRPFGKLTVDFRTNPITMTAIAKPLIVQALADGGMKIDDLDDWKVEMGPTTISLSGYLTTSGLRRAMAIIETPTSSESVADKSPPQTSPEASLSVQAKASLDHYRAVVDMFDDLKKDMGSVANLASTQTYFDKYAKRIERLPILNVDPEVLSYSAFVASSLRAASGAVRNMGIQSGVRQAEIVSSGAGGASYGRYGMYGGYAAVNSYDRTSDARAAESQRRVVRAEEKADMATNVQQLRAGVVSATTDIRRKMTQKYQVEF